MPLYKIYARWARTSTMSGRRTGWVLVLAPAVAPGATGPGRAGNADGLPCVAGSDVYGSWAGDGADGVRVSTVSGSIRWCWGRGTIQVKVGLPGR